MKRTKVSKSESKSNSKSKKIIPIYKKGMSFDNIYDHISAFCPPPIHFDQEEYVNIILPFRFIITGGTSCRKTSAMMHILKCLDFPFDHYILFIKTPEEPIYSALIAKIREIENKDKVKLLEIYTDLSDVSENDKDETNLLNGIDKTINTLLIADDCICDEKKDLKKINKVFMRGRKQNVSSILITQDFFEPNIKLARKNTSYVAVKYGLDQRYLQTLISRYCGDKKKQKEIIKMYEEISKNPNDFLLIDVLEPDQNKRFRRNLD